MAAEYPLLLQEMTREQARALAPNALVVLPTGSTEQHGPHMPTGTDFLLAEHITRTAAARVADRIPIVVAPTLPFGSSHHHLPFGGTISLPTDLYYRVLYEIGRSLVVDGFRRIFIVNGHGGNHEVVQLVVRDLSLEYDVHAAAGSYWVIGWDGLAEEGAHLVPGHAGPFETSCMMAIRPELVREPLPHRDLAAEAGPRTFEAPYRAEFHGSWQRINGFSGSPDQSTVERGRRYLEQCVGSTASALEEFYGRATTFDAAATPPNGVRATR